MNRLVKRHLIAALLLVPPMVCHAADSPRPNIVLCMSDDQGWGDTSYNGHLVLKTPNLDAMAANGMRFDRFYAAQHCCSPTRASVLTGRHPERYRCYGWGHDLPLREITLAEVLRAEGYATGHFGKWHLGGVPNGSGGGGRGVPESDDKGLRHPGNQGFETWFSTGNWLDRDPAAGMFFKNSTSKPFTVLGDSASFRDLQIWDLTPQPEQ